MKKEKREPTFQRVILVGEACRRLCISAPTAYVHAAAGLLPARRSTDGFWLFDEDCIDAIAEEKAKRQRQAGRP